MTAFLRDVIWLFRSLILAFIFWDVDFSRANSDFRVSISLFAVSSMVGIFAGGAVCSAAIFAFRSLCLFSLES